MNAIDEIKTNAYIFVALKNFMPRKCLFVIDAISSNFI